MWRVGSLLGVVALASAADLALVMPSGVRLHPPADADAAWARAHGIPKPDGFARFHRKRAAGKAYHGYSYAEPPPEHRHFGLGSLLACALCSLPVALREVGETGSLSSALSGLMIGVPLLVLLWLTAMALHWRERGELLSPSTNWTPTRTNLGLIFGPWTFIIWRTSAVAELKWGALLFAGFAYAYFATDAVEQVASISHAMQVRG